jgi:Ala-tRNA(Pro) deacylase
MTHRIEDYLERHHVPYEVISHGYAVTSLESARAANVDASNLVKAVLLEGKEGSLAALIPADQNIRLGQLSMNYGDNMHLADERSVRNIFTDCDPGAVPGLPMAWGVETVWDDDLLAKPDIYLESGDHEHLIHIETRYLIEAFGGMAHCHFCLPKRMH